MNHRLLVVTGMIILGCSYALAGEGSPTGPAQGTPPISAKITSAVQSQTIRDGLILWYDFDMDEGERVQDKSGKGNHGKLKSAVWESNGRNALDAAYEFDGKDDIIFASETGGIVTASQRDWTISMWIKPRPRKKAQCLYREIETKPCEDTAGVSLSKEGAICYNLRDSVGGYTADLALTSERKVADNEWHHVAVVTKDRKHHQIFLDGKPDKSQDAPILPLHLHLSLLGVSWDVDYHPPKGIGIAYYDGLMDDVMIWDRALSEKEVGQLYKATGGEPKQDAKDPIIGRWKRQGELERVLTFFSDGRMTASYDEDDRRRWKHKSDKTYEFQKGSVTSEWIMSRNGKTIVDSYNKSWDKISD